MYVNFKNLEIEYFNLILKKKIFPSVPEPIC